MEIPPMINRNFITNILGAALTAWTGNQAITGKLTVNQLMLAAPTAIVSFATGSKDSKLAELERRLSPSDRAAVKTIGGIVLNQIANRFGYRRINDDLASFDSRDRSNVLGSGAAGGLRDQYADRGDVGLNADTLGRMADGSNYGDRGTDNLRGLRIAPPENIRAQARRAADIARGRAPIEGTNIYPSEYAVLSTSGEDGPNGPRSEAW